MSEWEEKTLGDLITLKRGYDLPERLREEGTVPIYSSSGLSGFHSTSKVEPLGVVTGRYGSIGSVFLCTEPYWPLNTTLYVQDFKGSDAVFIYYFLQKFNWHQFNDKSAVPGVNRNDLHAEPIVVPPIAEQKQIAAVLTCLDRKIENLRKQNETLEAIAQTLFKHWFIDFEFPNADGKPYKSSGGAMEPSELGKIPEGWRVGKLEDFCTIFRGSSPRPITSPIFFKDGSIPWIKIADATKSNSIYLSETKEFCTEAALPHTRLLKKGSLILSNSATVGIPMILNLDGCIHDGWLSFRDYKGITRNFLFFVLTNKLQFLTKYADGTVQKNLNTGILKNMDFVVADHSLIQEFTAIVKALFDKILINEQQIQTLTKTRDALLPKLMSGQLRITE
ncbi:MAG: restriction endonuclease subunit S [Cyanobacteria bacterium P01_E01_bin.6]